MPPTTKVEELLKVGDVARRFQVHPSTVREWARTGKLPSRKTPGGGQFRFRRQDVDAFEPPADQPQNENGPAQSHLDEPNSPSPEEMT